MDKQSKEALIHKCTSESLKKDLEYMFNDLDNIGITYHPVEIDLTAEFNRFLQDSISEFPQKAIDKLKDKLATLKPIYFDICIEKNDDSSINEFAKRWAFNPLDDLKRVDSFGSGRRMEWLCANSDDVDTKILENISDHLTEGLTNLKKEFTDWLDYEYSFPYRVIKSSTTREYLPWSQNFPSGQYLYNSIIRKYGDFLKTIAGEKYEKIVELRRASYLAANEEVRILRAQNLNYLAAEELKNNPAHKIVNEIRMKQLLATVDQELYLLYPDYAKACLIK